MEIMSKGSRRMSFSSGRLTVPVWAWVAGLSSALSTAAKKYVDVALSEPNSTASTMFGTQILPACSPRFCFVAGLMAAKTVSRDRQRKPLSAAASVLTQGGLKNGGISKTDPEQK